MIECKITVTPGPWTSVRLNLPPPPTAKELEDLFRIQDIHREMRLMGKTIYLETVSEPAQGKLTGVTK